MKKNIFIKENINSDLDKILNEGVHDKGIFKAVFLAGGPGSGKDHVLSKTLSGHGLTELNSDAAFEHLMDKDNLDFKMPDSEQEARDHLRKKAKNITELKHRLSLMGRNGLIINGTASEPEKIKKMKQKLEELGYETSMLMVNTRDEVSQARNIQRGQRGGRSVPEDVRKQSWLGVQKARPELSKLFGHNYREVDNSEDLKKAPPEVVKQKEEEFNSIWKEHQKFVNTPVKNDVAKDWINKELEKKKRKPLSIRTDVQPHPDSNAFQQAKTSNLEYYGMGQYGKGGKVTHHTLHDKLKPIEVEKTSLTSRQRNKIQNAKETSKLPKDIKKESLNKELNSLLTESFSDPTATNLLLLGKEKDVIVIPQNISYLVNEKTMKYKSRAMAAKEAHRNNGRVEKDEAGNYYVIKESIDKGIEPGVSMAGSGEGVGRDTGEKIRKKDGKVVVTETKKLSLSEFKTKGKK